MYFSRLILNPRSRQVQVELSNPYEMHRTLMSAFPTCLESKERVLFRLEMRRTNPYLTLLVQSQSLPQWESLEEKDYLLSPAEVKTTMLELRAGQAFAFRIKANPSRRLKSDVAGASGKRIGLYKPADQEAWFLRKASLHGFNVLSLTITPQSRVIAYKMGGISEEEDSKKHRICQQAVLFEGILQVTDAALFDAALKNGIGSAKGFGFGLLSLAPPSKTA